MIKFLKYFILHWLNICFGLFCHYDFYLIFSRINSVFYIVWFVIIYIDVKRIKQLSITKNINLKQDFIKPTALSISGCTIPPMLNVLLSMMCSSLQINHTFLRICKCSARLTGSTGRDIFVLFWNTCNNTTFNKANTCSTCCSKWKPSKSNCCPYNMKIYWS